ncbi:TIR domain-containing protein [Phytopseudomonas daroniae]|uniref:TIR domain-containing protein n=1 Tax=Phytopseudomonas daroniae TaxID=2487519 RepID=UPI00103832A6|nr:TIR domain-containing protein [Pseudomonas daroniae]TBU75216.1 hypothetical protein DNK10_11210 [Pseudomonas daroniae]
MKVFISWSGTTSHKVAVILRDWLPSVIQSIDPYVSSEDIDKGARWSTDIAGELDASTYGVICLTPDNVSAPWINFEAGALGKSVEKSRVSPVLFRLKKSEVQGPLIQFQFTVVEKDDVLKLLQSMNNTCGDEGLDPVRLVKAFDVWWPDLERQLNEIPQDPPSAPLPAKKAPAEIGSMLEELIDLTRSNHKLLRDPMMQPASHFPWDRYIEVSQRSAAMSSDIEMMLRELSNYLEAHQPVLMESGVFESLETMVRQIERRAFSLSKIQKRQWIGPMSMGIR